MKSYFLVFAIIILLPIQAWSSDSYNIEMAAQDNHGWVFRNLLAYPAKNTTRVSGKITAFNNTTLPSGHIDIEAYSPTGEKVDELGLHFTPSRLTDTLRRQGGIAFTADFKKVLPPGTVFKVSFHRENAPEKSNTFRH